MQATLPNPNPLRLEELEEFRGLESNRDQRWLSHLRWMFDQQPDLCRQLHPLRKLGLWVDRKYQEALAHEAALLEQGASPEQAREVSNQLLTPPETPDNPPTPLPPELRRQIEASV